MPEQHNPAASSLSPRAGPHGSASQWVHPFAARLDLALRTRALTLTRVSHHLAQAGLPVSRSTLSNWRRGRSLPRYGINDPVITELETVLRLSPGVLRSLLSPEVNAGPPPNRASGEPDQATATVRPVMSLHTIEVDLDAGVVVVISRHVIEALTADPTEWEHVTRVAQANAPNGPLLEQGWVTTACTLPPQVRAGTSQVTSRQHLHRLADACAAHVEHVIVGRHQPMVLFQALFRGRQPSTVGAYRVIEGGPGAAEFTALRPINGRYQAVFRNSVHGYCGLRWTGVPP